MWYVCCYFNNTPLTGFSILCVKQVVRLATTCMQYNFARARTWHKDSTAARPCICTTLGYLYTPLPRTSLFRSLFIVSDGLPREPLCTGLGGGGYMCSLA